MKLLGSGGQKFHGIMKLLGSGGQKFHDSMKLLGSGRQKFHDSMKLLGSSAHPRAMVPTMFFVKVPFSPNSAH